MVVFKIVEIKVPRESINKKCLVPVWGKRTHWVYFSVYMKEFSKHVGKPEYYKMENLTQIKVYGSPQVQMKIYEISGSDRWV